MGADSYLHNSEKGLIEVAPLAYMRGRTLDNAFITVSYTHLDVYKRQVMNDKRLDSIPDVPTCQEAGYNRCV